MVGSVACLSFVALHDDVSVKKEAYPLANVRKPHLFGKIVSKV